MACNTSNPYLVTYPQNCDCCASPDCPTTYNAKCVVYSGPNLTCTEINTGDNLETALQQIEQKVCEVVGDYSTYNTYCLAPIYTQQEFVETISEAYCNLQDAFDTFVGTTFVNYQTSVTNQFTAITNPGLTCTYAGVTNVDTLNTILTKYCNTFGDIYSDIDVSGVDWTGGGCFVVPSPPTTVADGFQLVIDQLCSCCSSGVVLPTFNNLGSCLPSPGANDTLVQTIDKIKTRLCQTGTFDINALTWGCVVKPSSTTTNLQAAFQTVLNTLNDYIQNKLSFTADFTVTATDPMDICAGLTLGLATPIVSSDRLVASNVADLAPGTLIQKLTAGTNVTLDDTTIPGQVIINSTGSDTYKVKAESTDTTPDYLIDKIDGQNNVIQGIAITDTYNAISEQVELTPVIDWNIFINAMFDEIESDPTLQARFCAIVASCSSTTTTTTTTGASEFILDPQYGLYFTNIVGSGAGLPVFAYPVNTLQTATYVGLTAQTFTVTIAGGFVFPGDANVTLYVNSLSVACATLVGGATGTYALALPSAPLLGEEVRIAIGTGTCPP